MLSIANTANPSLALLDIRRLPARLTAEQAAEILGFKAHDIPLLLRAPLMKPLGGGPKNSVKYFHADEVEGLARNRQWLDKATRAISRRGKPPSKALAAGLTNGTDVRGE